MGDLKVVGRRIQDGNDWEDARRLLDAVVSLRGTTKLVPRGVFRFSSFEEADTWMIRMIARTHARHGSRTSSGSVDR